MKLDKEKDRRAERTTTQRTERTTRTRRSFNAIECERAFGSAYRSYRIDGRSRMDVDTFFSHIREELISLINRELTNLNSARVKMTTWIRFIQEFEDLVEINRVELAFNSRMTEVHRGSDLGRIVNGMIAHMKTQIENPALANSRFKFDQVLFLDVSFHQLNLTRSSSYIPLPDWTAKKKAIINPHNDDEKCFKWAVIAALEIGKDLQHVSNLKKFADNYDWSRLEFPFAINKIGIFEKKNDISVTVLALKGQEIYITRKSEHKASKNIKLLFITDGNSRHYTAIKSLSRLLGSRNTRHAHKQYFCLYCLQGFHSELSRDKHYEYCKDNKAVKIEMPKPGSFVEFHNGQNQFKVPFTMYADFEVILRPVHGPSPSPNEPYTKKVNRHIPSGFCVYSKFAYGEIKDPLKLYRGKDCVQVFCDYLTKEARRLYHMSPEKPMEPLTSEEWKGYNQATKCHICFKPFEEINPKVRDHCHYTSKQIQRTRPQELQFKI